MKLNSSNSSNKEIINTQTSISQSSNSNNSNISNNSSNKSNNSNMSNKSNSSNSDKSNFDVIFLLFISPFINFNFALGFFNNSRNHIKKMFFIKHKFFCFLITIKVKMIFNRCNYIPWISYYKNC